MTSAADRALAPGLASGPRLRGLLSSRTSFVVLVVLVAATLAVGSVHHAPPTDAQRISYLDNIIKCPSCPDLSIAQSNASTAVGLRATVAQMVHAGQSDAAIEAYAVHQFTASEILVPTGGLTALEWVGPLVALLVAGAALLVALARRARPKRRASAADEALVAAARRRDDGP